MPQFIFEKNMLGNSKINSKLWASKLNVPAAKPGDLSSFNMGSFYLNKGLFLLVEQVMKTKLKYKIAVN